ncbi:MULTISPECIES: tetratricopeptide repeat protein [Thermodesulfovibrio]|uniref:Tetratricopeptide repeat domain protein n=2 Tax=Thermodesulfovibrio yellowstonii TaxID=28262 RepID=B5YJN6_THEYD|nr:MULTISPECIES: tetratricopeptide repeat protein [Thermodesulfovibrio]ACI20227.1 tetratricopeptide repeat domain protein [Thermodesulfovibrio yellowstonii DSM 11347]MDI6864297.1 tetratricopeptide repeat protein [Thermodesulfovibrio yellowstonii]GLI54023.1 tetratricopeptide repeat domain protein [Thermodesulfovibrio islandicus]
MKQKPEDVQTLKEKLFAQKKKLVIGIFVFLGIVFLITGFYVYNLKQETDAKELQYEAYKALLQQKFSQAGDLFIKAYEKKKNITYLINAGYAYSFAGDNKKAIEYLSKVASMNDENFSNLAKFKMAMIYLKDNDKERATKTLKEIIDGKSTVMKDVALFEMAKISDNKDEAKKYYEEIINKFPSSTMVESAKAELQKLSN